MPLRSREQLSQEWKDGQTVSVSRWIVRDVSSPTREGRNLMDRYSICSAALIAEHTTPRASSTFQRLRCWSGTETSCVGSPSPSTWRRKTTRSRTLDIFPGLFSTQRYSVPVRAGYSTIKIMIPHKEHPSNIMLYYSTLGHRSGSLEPWHQVHTCYGACVTPRNWSLTPREILISR